MTENRRGVVGEREFVLSSQLEREICAYIIAGAFPHIAAEAAGVPKHIFDIWIDRGNPFKKRKGSRPNPLYGTFWRSVFKARAQARLVAEIAAFKGDPLAWLKSGPGKETAESPGWSTPIKPMIHEDNRTFNLLLAPEMQGLFAGLLQVLAPYPEARAAVAEALGSANTHVGGGGIGALMEPVPKRKGRKVVESAPEPEVIDAQAESPAEDFGAGL